MKLGKMVSKTRSSRKIKEEVDGRKMIQESDNVKGFLKYSLGKMTPSPKSKKECKHHGKLVSPSTPQVTRKSIRLEKLDTPSPTSISAEKKKNMSSSSGSKQPVREHNLSNLNKGKKKKNLAQLTKESEKAELNLESVGLKRKRMNARYYNALFKSQWIKVVLTDVDVEPDGPAKISQIYEVSNNGVGMSSKTMWIEDNVRDECNRNVLGKLGVGNIKAFDGDLQKSNDSSRGQDVGSLKNDALVDSNDIDNVVNQPPVLPDRDDLEDSRSNSKVGETCNASDMLVANHIPIESIDVNISGSLVCMERSQKCSESSDHGENCKQTEASDSNTSLSKSESPRLLGTCVVCHKKRRLTYGSAEQKLCSCMSAVSEDQSSFGASKGNFESMSYMNSNQNDEVDKLEKLSHFKQFKSSSEASKFLEYWVPVQISNYQLEMYCDALFNSNALRSCFKRDNVGASSDILLIIRKCCDHPYLVDSSMQKTLFDDLHPASEILEIGIRSSGKLHLLDLMIAEIKSQGLKVLILYQNIKGPEGASIGDILDDFVRQRFGEDTYERIDARIINSKKQAAMHQFNKKEAGRFIFLLENRACSSSIKLSSLDLIIIYDSDLNPANDFRAIQKISIDSNVKPVRIFRLYSFCTVEERALVLSKQKKNLSKARSRVDALLMWGARNLFRKLEDYHAESDSPDLNCASEQLFCNEIYKEFQAIISEKCEIIGPKPLISKATLDIGSYDTETPLLGEKEVELINAVEPHMFWRNLLHRKRPQWKHLSSPCPRNRKRAQRLVGLPMKSGSENGDTSKKSKILMNDDVDPSDSQDDLMEHQVTQSASPEGGLSTTIANNRSESFPGPRATNNSNTNCMFYESTFVTEVDSCESEKRYLHEQKNLHRVLEKEVTKLCQLLKLSEEIIQTAKKILEYVIKNHDVSSDSPAITQAFQISLCWIAALISKQKVDKKLSISSAKQLLNYHCTEEQVNSVHLKLQSLVWMHFQSLDSASESVNECLLSDEDVDIVNENPLLLTPFKLKNVKFEMEDILNEKHSKTQGSELMIKVTGSEIQGKVNKMEKEFDNRMLKFIEKQQEEVQELQRTWEEERVKLEADHNLESAVASSIHGGGSIRISKLRTLDDSSEKQMIEHNLLKNMMLKTLKAKQLTAQNEEMQEVADQVLQTVRCSNEFMDGSRSQPLGFQSDSDVGCSQSGEHPSHIGLGNGVSMPQLQLENQNLRRSVCSQGNDLSPTDTAICTQAELVGCNYPTETQDMSGSVISLNERGSSARSPLAVVEKLNNVNVSSYAFSEMGSANLPVSVEQFPDEGPAALLNGEAPTGATKIVPSEVRDELDDSSNDDPHFPVSTALDDASLSFNQSPVSDTERQNQDLGSSSRTAEAGETEELFPDFISQGSEALQLHDDRLDLRSASGINSEKNGELLSYNLHSTAITEAMNRASELPEQLGIDMGQLHARNHPLVPPVHQIFPRYPTPSLPAEPLQSEIERLVKEAEMLKKTYKDLISQLRSDCEKEIREVIAKIRDKYQVKIKDAEAEFILQKNEVKQNQNKIFMNKKLAEAFRFKCLNLKPSLRMGMMQAFPSSFVQHLRQYSMPSSTSASGMSTCSPFLGQQIVSPNVQAVQQLPLPRSVRCFPVSSAMTAPSQASQLAAPMFSGSPSTAPAISSFTSAAISLVGGSIRCPAPHLQTFRPAAAPCASKEIWSPAPDFQPFGPSAKSTSQHHAQEMPHTSIPVSPSPQPPSPIVVSQNIPEPKSDLTNPLNLFMPRSQHCPLMETSSPSPSPSISPSPSPSPSPPPSKPPSPQLTSSNSPPPNIPENESGLPNPHTMSVSSMGPLKDMNTDTPMNHRLPPLPDVDSTFAPLEPSDFDSLVDVQNNNLKDYLCMVLNQDPLPCPKYFAY